MKTVLKRNSGMKLNRSDMRSGLDACRSVKLNQAQGSASPSDTFYRILENSDIRITEDNNNRILE